MPCSVSLDNLCYDLFCSRFKITNRFEDDQSFEGQSSGNTPGSERSAVSQQMQHHQQYLGDIAAGLPELPDVEIDETQGKIG